MECVGDTMGKETITGYYPHGTCMRTEQKEENRTVRTQCLKETCQFVTPRYLGRFSEERTLA